MNNSAGDPSNPVPVSTTRSAADDDRPADDEWVIRARAGDAAAYDVLVGRHSGRLYAMIRNLVHNDADAWDLSQEAFIKAWQALPRFEGKSSFSTWLFRIARNVVLDWARRRRPETAAGWGDGEGVVEGEDPADAPDEALRREELRGKIEAALAKLSPEHRQVVVWKDVHGMAYKDIAVAAGCSIGTVMSRLHYARQKLQTLLHDEYDTR